MFLLSSYTILFVSICLGPSASTSEQISTVVPAGPSSRPRRGPGRPRLRAGAGPGPGGRGGGGRARRHHRGPLLVPLGGGHGA